MVELTLSDISKKLTVEVIQHAFRIITNSADNVKRVTVKRAAPAGEGLIGAVYRITVKGELHKTCIIAKGCVNDLLLKKSLMCAEIFNERETFFYTSIMPILIATQKALGARETLQKNIPICYGSYIDGNDDYILLEDVAENGCKSLTTKATEHERDCTLKTLAHLHAVSMALRVTKPEVFNAIADKLPEAYYNNKNRDWYAAYLQNAIDLDFKVLAEFEDSSSVYYKKFEELISKNVYTQLIELSSHRDELAVFNHGDAWIPNFLCSDELAVAIDFQAFRCTSVAIDLSYFLLLCCNLVRTKEDFYKSVEIYYDNLKYFLGDMGIDYNKVFSWDTLNEELKKYGKFGLLACLTSIPLLASEKYDVLENYAVKFPGYERIPLEYLWALQPMTSEDHKQWLMNAIRITVDTGLI